MLRWLKEMVTFLLSSFSTSFSGGGRKSLTRRVLPIGPSVYLIFFFINFSSLAPITCTKNSYSIITAGKSYCHNIVQNLSKAIVAFFIFTVFKIFMNYTKRIKKHLLCFSERNTMFPLIFEIFFIVPFKAVPVPEQSLEYSHIKSNINNHINIHTA